MGTGISAVTVTWNSAGVLMGLLESLKTDAGAFSEIVIVDNASTDGTTDIVRSELAGARLIENASNAGFAAAANQGIRASSGEYVLLVNPDVSFGPGFAETLSSALESDPKAGSAAPKLVRPDGMLDSAGLAMLKYRKAVDRGRDRPDTGQYDAPCRVFGASGAAALYSRKALNEARVIGEYFDESFFSYKEDVDLAWRLNLLGWKCVYEPRAVGRHARGWKASARKDVPKEIRRHSFKNHYLTILKNDDSVNLLLHLPWVLAYDTALFLYALFREPYLLGAVRDVIRLMPGIAEKREAIMASRKSTPAEMRRLFE